MTHGAAPDVLVVVGRPTFDLASARPLVAAAIEYADPSATVVADGRILETPEEVADALSDVDPIARRLIVLFASFTDSRLTAAAVDHFESLEQIALWSFPETWDGGRLRRNSLCGANLAAFRLVGEGRRVVNLHESPGPESFRHLDRAIERLTDAPTAAIPASVELSDGERHRVARVVASIRDTRLGVIGAPPDGFEPCEVGDERMPAEVGLERVVIDELFEGAERPLTVADHREVTRRRDLPGNASLPRAAVETAVSLQRGVERMAQRHGWNAVAIRCWPECFEHCGAVCATMAELNDSGLPAACEADAFGALTMRSMQTVADQPSFLADVVDADLEADRVVFWHCGVAPPSLASDPESVRVGLHPNRQMPLVYDFGLAPGPVTFARWSQGPDELRLVVGEGRIVDGQPFQGTSCVVQLATTARSFLDAVFEAGVEHHVALVPGHHQRLLEAVAAELGAPVVRLTEPTAQIPA